ncbi:MAG: TIGR03009 domain-containing protein [Gemmataceae bacterium]
MRVPVIVLAGVLTSGTWAGAQTTPAGAPATPPAVNNAKLDGYLLRWEQEMKKVQTLAAVIARIDKDKSFGTTTKLTGVAQYMKAGNGPSALNLAMLELKQEGKTDMTEKVICTGTYLYQFRPAQKEIHAYEMPRPKPGQVADDGFLGLMFGMRAEEARRRFVLNLYKEDAYYVYVDITPRFPADRADFARARLVLLKDTFMPRQLWFEHPNGNEVTWDIPSLRTGVSLDRRNFDAPRTPTGWKLVPVNRTNTGGPTATPASTGGNPPPRVIRQND